MPILHVKPLPRPWADLRALQLPELGQIRHNSRAPSDLAALSAFAVMQHAN